MFTKEKLEEMLKEALTAQHTLMMGDQAVSVRDSNGDLVSYSAANASRLADYIAWLRNELEALNRPKIRGPFIPVWS